MNLENAEVKNTALPCGDETETAAKEDTTPKNAEEIFVPVKYNRETKELKLDEAARLAQKGLKFEAIADDYEALKGIAAENGRSVTAFLSELAKNMHEKRKCELAEKCGGNAEMAEYVMKLENSNEKDNGFAELKKEFPEIKDISDLPEKVVEDSRLKGTLLLDEYLRYRRAAEREAAIAAAKQRSAENLSIGSQTDRGYGTDPEAAEFLKGLWK